MSASIDKNNSNHPVWNVYDEYRTARLNVRYLEEQLKNLQKKNFWIEFSLAVSTSSSVAGQWLWENAIGGYAWKVIGLIAAFLAILKPIIKLTEKIRKKSEKLSGYRLLEHELHKIKILISEYNKYDENLRKLFLKALDFKGELIKKHPEEHIDHKLREKCEKIVNNELPSNSFFIPEG
ncbi:MAG: hypothetical protein HYS21_00035 [Deltaproteobacteria bacterium]|nr:hypothetical protein [Deltaproteobacteria bacterium]